MNAVSTDRRKYQLRARAERQRETRARIIDATVALHAEVGPARTTIADIARRAGVQRLTVYNTFPDLRELFAACQAKFLGDNPPPPVPTVSTRNPLRGLEALLRERYAWYRSTRPMEEKVHRDRHLVPELDALMAATGDARLDAIAEAQAAALGRMPRRREQAVRALIRLALEYRTWEVLADHGMTDAASASLMARAVAAATATRYE